MRQGRRHLAETGGARPRTYRSIYDTWGTKGEGENRTYSLWASPAEKAVRELRSLHRKQTGKPPKVERKGNTTTIRLTD